MPKPKTLPTFYYLTHFNEFLNFVKGPCEALLSDVDKHFIANFESLNKDSQCLLVRTLNRKSPFIKTSSLFYDEIFDVEQQIEQLIQVGLLKSVSSSEAIAWIKTLTKAELINIISPYEKVLSSWPKQTLMDKCSTLSAQEILSGNLKNDYVSRNVDHHVDYFLYLYFGNTQRKLNQFSMRDLGVMRTRKEQAQVMARFDNIEAAKSAFGLHTLLDQLKASNLSDKLDKELSAIYKALPEAIGQRATELKQHIQFLLAKPQLKHNQALALVWLEEIPTDDAQEKWVRESYKAGNKTQVEERLEALIDNPISSNTLAFAEDFLARKYKKKKTSVLTDMLRENSQRMYLDEMHKTSVERGVVDDYKSKGVFAQRTENDFWRSLFGLFFWEEIYDTPGYGLVNEFDHAPLSLKKDCLYKVAKDAIEHKLQSITSNEQLFKFLSHQAVKHHGKGNYLFKWKAKLLSYIKPVIEAGELISISKQLKAMTQSWTLLSDGYPDICVIENGKLRFEEIKSEGDQLRRNQLLTIQTLRENGFDVRITNVEWIVDPMQPYVVVDIETTGARAQLHRITEVGMVKMVDNQIVDRWQSLINPQRRIPANITSLTGIDNEMVSDAPLFAEVADEIERFTQGSVFVAHNVNFDYGFIKEEFARLDRGFKRAKLCTVSQMRKHYKGLASYSLANLTRHFDIGMQRHHRAMSDAIAASELLIMINEKRLGQ